MNRYVIATIGMIALCMHSALAFTTTKTDDLKVWFDPITLTADGKTVSYLQVFQHHDNENYAAFNMTLVVPKGVKINKVKKGRELVNDIELSERATTAHSIACNMLDDGETIKIISDPAQFETYYNDDEDGNPLDLIFTLGLIAEPSTADGEHEVSMSGIKFVYPNADATVPEKDPYVGIFTVNGGTPTGIEVITNYEKKFEGDYFDLSGKNVGKSPSPGIYIRNGEKVVVK